MAIRSYVSVQISENPTQIALHAAANFSSSKNCLPRKQKEAREPYETLRINIRKGKKKRKKTDAARRARALDYRSEIFPRRSLLIARVTPIILLSTLGLIDDIL